MANLKDLIVNGSARILGTIYGNLSGNATTATTATKLGSATVGNSTTPIYLNAGTPTALSYTIAKSVPSDANFSNTTYSAGSGLALSGTTINHATTVTAATAGTNAATSGSTLAVPYVTYNATGHITAAGTHTHTVTGFSTTGHTHTKSQITDFPTIPTVNNSGVTIKRNGTAIGSFTLNQTSAANIDITVPTTYTDVSAASSGHTHSGYAASTHKHTSADVTALTSYTIATQAAAIAATDSLNVALGKLQKSIDGKQASGNYVPTSRTINSKQLTANISLTYTDVSAASSGHTHSGYQSTATAVTHTQTTAVGNTVTPVYVASDGKATALSYTIAKSVPSNANFDNTTYSAGSGLTLSGTTINHSTTITAGTAGTSAATSGATIAIPYVTYNGTGHITAAGTHTHTVTVSGSVKCDGISGATINRYCSCSTAAATAAKTADVTSGTVTLEAGLRVTVKFTNANTAGTPTLNINSKGAKNIFLNGEQITTGSNKGVLKGVVEFVYDGTQWHIVSIVPMTIGMIA